MRNPLDAADLQWRLTGQVNPVADESFQSLIVRSLRASGFPYAPHGLKHAFEEPRFWYRAAWSNQFDIERLASFLNQPACELRTRHTAPRQKIFTKERQPYLLRPVAWHDAVFDGRLLSHRSRRQPIGRIAGVNRHLRIWAIRSIDFCLYSGLPLTDVCPTCGTRLGWDYIDLERCHKCRSELLSDNVDVVPGLGGQERIKIHSLVGAASGCDLNWLRRLGPPFSDWDRGEFFIALLEIVFLERLLRMPSDERRRARFDTMRSVTPSELHIAWNSINNLDAYLFDFLSKFGEPLRVVSIKQHLQPLNRILAKKVKGPLSYLIMKTLPKVVGRRWPGCVMNSTGILSPNKARATNSVLTESGVSKKRLLELNAEPEALIARSSGPKGWKVYDERRVKVALEEFGKSVPLDEVSWRYGFHSHLVEGVLKRLGLSAVEDRLVQKLSRGAKLFNRSELSKWLSEITRCDGPMPVDGFPVSTIMAGFVDPVWWYELVNALVDRRLKIFRQDEEFNLNSSLISKSDFENWLAGAKIIPSGDLSEITLAAEPAARVSGMSQGTVVSAINNGLLLADFRERKWSIRLSDLKSFLDQYAHLGELSLGAITHRPDVANALQQSGLSPKARLTSATLWDRAELYLKLSQDPDLLPGVFVDRIDPAFPR